MKYIIGLWCLLTLAACNSKKPETTQVYPKTPTGLQGIQESAPKNSAQAGNTGALNPAHGQPGHRCDLAVGAPLNSTPTQATATQVTTQATPAASSTPTVVPTANVKGQKLNPAHGQPGHKCEIPVGAPLT